jgi:tape measure domain-containing protein
MKTILYKTGLFCIIIAWAIYVLSFLILLIPGSILRLFGVKFLYYYAFKFNRWVKSGTNWLKNQYITEVFSSLPDFKMDHEEARKLYITISNVFIKLGCSEEQKTNGLTAIWQMLAKDIIEKEDWYQLGNSLPGCGNIMAKTLGFKMSEMHKKINNKQLVSSEILPKFRIELEKTYLNIKR